MVMGFVDVSGDGMLLLSTLWHGWKFGVCDRVYVCVTAELWRQVVGGRLRGMAAVGGRLKGQIMGGS